MGLPEFSAATVEEMESGVVRIRGKGLELNKTANLTFLIFFGFGCFASAMIFFGSYSEAGFDDLGYLFGSAAFALVFFTLMGLIPYFLLTYGMRLLRVATGYHKLWWDDFTFDGKDVKSGRFKFNVGDISFVESGIQKFTESDPWHYASIMSSNGVEIGRVMVVYRDKKKMVNYLSDLFEAT